MSGSTEQSNDVKQPVVVKQPSSLALVVLCFWASIWGSMVGSIILTKWSVVVATSSWYVIMLPLVGLIGVPVLVALVLAMLGGIITLVQKKEK